MSKSPDRFKWQPPELDVRVNKEAFEQFWSFIYERQRIWYRRFVKMRERPWTKDPILVRSKYTNVYRELDRGTIYLKENILDKNKSLHETLWEICVYRLLNKVETFQHVGIISLEDYHGKKRDKWFASLAELRDSGATIWTSAHITLQSSFKHDRLENYRMFLDKLHPHIIDLAYTAGNTNDIQEFFKAMKGEFGFGPFTAYEVATDVAYIDDVEFSENDWANPGPGCQLGLRIIYPRSSSSDDFQAGMVRLRDGQKRYFKRYDLNFKKIRPIVNGKSRWLSLRNIEHSLCEYGKYHKQVLGVGKARMIFVPTTTPGMVQ